MDKAAARQAVLLIAGASPQWPSAVAETFNLNLQAAAEVVTEATGLTIRSVPPVEIVDRVSWADANIETMDEVLGEFKLGAPGTARMAGWQLGAVLGLASRAVIGQYDPFSHRLLFVGPNLSDFSDDDGSRWILFHELTHVAQFNAAPWITDEMKQVGKALVGSPRKQFARELSKRIPSLLPKILSWAADLLRGRDPGEFGPMDLLPEPERLLVERLNSMMTVLEGHATVVTDLVSESELDRPQDVEERVMKRRHRPGWLRLVEGIAGLEAKRAQYTRGRTFVEAVFAHGGNEALSPFFESAENIPTKCELQDPIAWLKRVGGEAAIAQL